MKTSVILACAGKGVRAEFKDNKLLQKIGNITVFEKTFSVFEKSNLIDEIIVACSKEDLEVFKTLTKNVVKKTTFVLGGKTRTESVYNALKTAETDIVLIHDGARPFLQEQTIENCVKSVKEFSSGIACCPCVDTLAYSEDGKTINKSVRQGFYNVQTPQGFLKDEILSCYEKAMKSDKTYTDDASVYGDFLRPAHICEGDSSNKKLTYKSDFSNDVLVGTGFDLHRLVTDRKLILGGVEIPHDKGLLGHSDADVLTHAVMDAILSALSLGDIGKHFPDKDPAYKGISSIVLLKKVLKIIKNQGYKVRNVSAVIMAEKPKLSTFTEKISTTIAEVIHIDAKRVGITCTTLEGVGLVGREEAIACQAYCMLEKA